MEYGQQHYVSDTTQIRLMFDGSEMVQTIFGGSHEDSPSSENTIIRRVLSVADKQIKKALMEHGWKPPGEVQSLGRIDGNEVFLDHSIGDTVIEVRVGRKVAQELKCGRSDTFDYVNRRAEDAIYGDLQQ